MNGPTIDELIAQTDDYYRDPEQYVSRVYLEAIRAILEQHREQISYARMSIRRAEIVTIRAFVEQVEARYEDTPFTYPGEVFELMWKEVDAMEKDAK